VESIWDEVIRITNEGKHSEIGKERKVVKYKQLVISF
jgi:hypothetical protein